MLLGTHYIGTIKVTDASILASSELIRSAMQQVCDSTSLDIVSETKHVFSDPTAITYCFVLSQSHFVVHTWPEHNIIAFDLFSCTSDVSGKNCADVFAEKVQGTLLDLKEIGV